MTGGLVCPACGARFQAPDVGSAGTLPRCPHCEAAYPSDGAIAAGVQTLEVPEPDRAGPAGPAAAPRVGPGARRPLRWPVAVAAGVVLAGVSGVVGVQMLGRRPAHPQTGATPQVPLPPPPGVVGASAPGLGGGSAASGLPAVGPAGGAASRAVPADWPSGGWLQDVEEAMRLAAVEKKDLLIVFDSSDASADSPPLIAELFSTPAFRERAGRWFKLVYLDCPRHPTRRVANPARNRQAAARYMITPRSPTVLLADDRGRPYGLIEGVGSKGMELFFRRAAALREARATRDRLLAEVARAKGEARVRAAREEMAWLGRRGLLWEYAGELEAAVREVDPRNERGELEAVCQAGFEARWSRCTACYPDGVAALAVRLEQWEQEFRFKDANGVGRMHLGLAHWLAQANDPLGARRQVRAAMEARPTEPSVRLGLVGVMIRLGYGVGVGFVAAPGGYVITVHDAVLGPGRLLVQWPGAAQPAAAEVVARDEAHDLAVVRAPPPPGAAPRPLPLAASRALARDEAVAVLGQILGGSDVRFGPKRTAAVLSALPEARGNQFLVIDGNFTGADSGGVACDAFGNVVGLVTYRSLGGPASSSRAAVSAGPIDDLARKAIPGYRPPVPGSRRLEWDVVDRRAGPSVVPLFRSP